MIPLKGRLFRPPRLIIWFFPRRVWRGKTKHIFLTFDDGPHPEITPWLLDELKKQNVKASFFWNGREISKYPELLERAKREGHAIGHHGYYHYSGRNLSFQQFKENFDAAQSLVPTHLFRPPYGRLKKKQERYAAKTGKVIMWSWMSYDFDPNLPTQQIMNRAKMQIKERDILVFHENEKTKNRIKKIIPPLLQIIQDKNLNFAVLEE